MMFFLFFLGPATPLAAAPTKTQLELVLTVDSTQYDVSLVAMIQTNRRTKFARAVRRTDQGRWEWEEGSPGSGDWQS